MKTLLICPAIRPAVAQLAVERPLATLPILGECLVNHWIEHVTALGARHVIVLAADRAEEVSAAVGNGERWGVRVEVVHVAHEPSVAEATERFQSTPSETEPAAEDADWQRAPRYVVTMAHLPGRVDLPLFESYAGWFAAATDWMPRALTPTRVRVSEIRPGIWVGRRARISPRATLVAPCWIGDQAYIGERAVVGRGAVIEDRAVVETGAQVLESYVAPDTFVGRMTSLAHSLALGGTVINWQTDSVLTVPDPFLLCSLVRSAKAKRPGLFSRMRNSLIRLASLPGNAWSTLGTRSDRASDLKLPG